MMRVAVVNPISMRRKVEEKRIRSNYLWILTITFLASLSLLLLSEFGLLYWSLKACVFPQAKHSILFAAVADIHVLGTRKSLLDVFWTDWQTRKSFWFITHVLNPRGVFVLGDHFDQGGYASETEWDWYLKRYRWITRDLARPEIAVDPIGSTAVTENQQLLVDSVIGNHDAQFAYLGLTREMLERFENGFGNANGFLRLDKENIEIVWINAMALFDNSSKKHEAHKQTQLFLDQLPPAKMESTIRILLSHVPTFRKDDLDCGKTRIREQASVTFVAPEEPLQSAFDVFTEEISLKLLQKVRPQVMLSGHLHSQCHRINIYDLLDGGHEGKRAFMDISVPSFCYRMRPDPGLVLLNVQSSASNLKDQIRGRTCVLPRERLMIVLDILAVIGLLGSGGLGLVIVIVRIRARSKAKAV